MTIVLNNQVIFPEKDDLSDVDFEQIVGKVNTPTVLRRGVLQFTQRIREAGKESRDTLVLWNAVLCTINLITSMFLYRSSHDHFLHILIL